MRISDWSSDVCSSDLKTRWGRTLVGHFPHYEGVVAALPDGRHQVRLRLSAATVEIEDSPTFTRLTRGDGFFEADRFEWVEFVSDPYPDALMREGGRLGGPVPNRGLEGERKGVGGGEG